MRRDDLSPDEVVALVEEATAGLSEGAYRVHVLTAWECDEKLFAEVVISDYGARRWTQWWRSHLGGPKMSTMLVWVPLDAW